MASARPCLVSWTSSAWQTVAQPRAIAAAAAPRFPAAAALGQTRLASYLKKPERKKPKNKAYRVYDKADLVQFSLCDAVRYLRAVEVGRPPVSVTYDIAVKIQGNKDGAVLRDRIRLPFPCNTDFRIAVICKEDSPVAADARAAGAVAVGEESLFEAIRKGEINFNRLLCHADSVPALTKAGLGQILGPRGLMPNVKNKTIVNDVRAQMRDIAGTENYRERGGVVRMAIGQLHFTPEMLGENIRALVAKLKLNMLDVEETTPKAIDEVVLSTTHGPGMSLSGAFTSTDSKVTPAHLSTVM